MRATWRPRLILLLVSVAVGLVVGEGAARLVGIRPIAALPLPVQVAMEHPALGWVNRPGVHLSWDTGNAPMTFWADGRRATRATADAPPEAVGQVALVGGSFTQGYGVADEHAFGWLLDTRFPGLSVDNYGTGGYGTYQSLLLLEQLFREADFRPSLVIYGFAAFHGERNVGAYRHVVTLRTQVGERLAPPHVLLARGELTHRDPFYIRGWPLEDRSALISLMHLSQLRWTLRGREQQIEPVTQRLLVRMDRLARDRGSRLLVAILEGQSDHREGYAPYVRFLQDQGIAFVDCTHPEYGDDPRLRLGGSGHPSPVLHTAWADCIAAWISANVPGTTGAARARHSSIRP